MPAAVPNPRIADDRTALAGLGEIMAATPQRGPLVIFP
jgi:hypothetical protein